MADYARAQANYRSGLASGNGDLVIKATDTFSLIAREVLSRQDPSLFDGQVACERHQVAGPQYRRDTQTTYDPQFVQDCQRLSCATTKRLWPSAGTSKRGSRPPTARPSPKGEGGTPEGLACPRDWWVHLDRRPWRAAARVAFIWRRRSRRWRFRWRTRQLRSDAAQQPDAWRQRLAIVVNRPVQKAEERRSFRVG